MTIQDLTDFLDEKINENEDILHITVYELRVKLGLSKEEVDGFLELAKTRLENLNYQVYFTGAKYTYNGVRQEVQSNDYLLALKERGEK